MALTVIAAAFLTAVACKLALVAGPTAGAEGKTDQIRARAPLASQPPVGTRGTRHLAKFTWSELESEDHSVFIAKLRAFQMPEQVVRDILRQRLRRQLGLVQESVGIATNWTPVKGVTLAKITTQKRELEFAREWKRLFGGDPAEYLAGWPTESLAAAREFFETMQAKLDDADAEVLRTHSRESLLARARLRRECLEGLAKIGGEGPALDVCLKIFDGVRSTVRTETYSFDPSESEFKLIFKLRLINGDAFLGEISPAERGDFAEEAKRHAQILQEIKLALGEDRFADFKKSQTIEFRNAYGFTERLNLGRDVAVSIASIERYASASLSPFQTKQMSWEEKRQAADAIGAQLGAVLNVDQMKAYVAREGMWFNGLTNRMTQFQPPIRPIDPKGFQPPR